MTGEAYEVRNAMMERQLKEMGKHIAAGLPNNWGFMLYFFEFGPGGSTFYISNAQRDDVIRLLREFIERQEPGSGSPGGRGR